MPTKRKAKQEPKVEVAPLCAAVVRAMLDYDESTGLLRWKERPGNNRFNAHYAGHVAASKHNRGYAALRINGRAYLAHRVAWLWMTGRWPKDQIDHRNGDRGDNRFANLRECSNAENCQNVRAHKDGVGLVGVSLEKRTGRWQAGIGINGRRIYLGYYASKEDAHAAYLRAKAIHHTSMGAVSGQ